MNVNKILWYINIPDGLSPSVSSSSILEGLEDPMTKRSFSLHDMETAQPRIYAVLCFMMLPLKMAKTTVQITCCSVKFSCIWKFDDIEYMLRLTDYKPNTYDVMIN